jgi:hypothetical protein
MGRPRTPGLEWLDPSDGAQLEWAWNYLLERGFGKHLNVRDGHHPSYRDLLAIGNEMERRAETREVLNRMRSNCRKRRSTAKQEMNAVMIKRSAKEQLTEIAQQQGASPRALLEKLIEKAYRTHQKKSLKQISTPIAGDRRDIGLLMPKLKTATKEPTQSENADHLEPFLGAPLPLPRNQDVKIHTPRWRTPTITLSKHPSAEVTDQTEQPNNIPENDVQEPPHAYRSGEAQPSVIAPQEVEQRADTPTVEEDESIDIWLGTAPTDDDLRYAFEKAAQAERYVAESLRPKPKA